MDTIFVSLVFFILFIFLAIGAVLVYTYAWSCLLSRYSWEEEGSEEFEISTEGLVGNRSLVAETPVETVGYIRIRKRNSLDRLLFQKSYKGLSVEYDDELWANKLFSLKEFVELVDRLFEEHKIDWFELKGNRLKNRTVYKKRTYG